MIMVAELLEYHNESMSKSEVVYFRDGSVELPQETSLQIMVKNIRISFIFW